MFSMAWENGREQLSTMSPESHNTLISQTSSVRSIAVSKPSVEAREIFHTVGQHGPIDVQA